MQASIRLIVQFSTIEIILASINPKDFLLGPTHYFPKFDSDGQEIDNELELIKPENIIVSDNLISVAFINDFHLAATPSQKIFPQYEIRSVYPSVQMTFI